MESEELSKEEEAFDLYGGHYRRPHLPTTASCPNCGAKLIQANRKKIVLAGAAFNVVAIVGIVAFHDWIFTRVILPIGAMFVVWGTIGNGQWCNRCGHPTRWGKS